MNTIRRALQKSSHEPFYKTDTKNEAKSNNFCNRKFGRAITIREAIEKRIYKSDAKNEVKIVSERQLVITLFREINDRKQKRKKIREK